MLADVATDLEAARLLTAEAAAAVNRNESTIAAAHAKKFATRAALKGLADCMQVMGAAGFSEDYPLARHLASAKMAQFLDGTTEIQNVVIARDLMRRVATR
jgi:alkylation response protein AidB-like acyl-CoA dehydrogenase